MHIYHIPTLYCPFPSMCHPGLKAIEAHTMRWVANFELLTAADEVKKYRDQQYAAMIAWSYPYGELADLCTWNDMNTLLFLVDDLLDEQDIIKDQDALTRFEKDFLAVLDQNRFCTIDQDGPILTALADFWSRMHLCSDEAWRYTFVQHTEAMFAAARWQFSLVAANRLPGLEEYIRCRQYLGAANLATEGIKAIGKVQLPDEIYQVPAVQQLTEIARNTVCFANDLFSLSKEIALSNGAEFNLVVILKRTYDLTMEAAIRKAVDIHDQFVRDFIRISETACVYDAETNHMLSKYIDCLRHFMKGNIEWSTKATSRYPHRYGDYSAVV